MALVKCNSCGAEYRTVQRDGSTYFHVCPPQVILKAVKEDGSEIEQPLEQYAGLTVVETRAQKKELVDAGGDPTKIVVVRQRRDVRRPDHRDENTRAGTRKPGEPRELRAEGKGVTTLKTDAEMSAADNA